VRAELTRLQAAEFLYEVGLFPDLEYTFKHALTHEVAYHGLLQHRQRALHARITEAIERFSSERIPDQAERLARHAVRGPKFLLQRAAGPYIRVNLRPSGSLEQASCSGLLLPQERTLWLRRGPATSTSVASRFTIRECAPCSMAERGRAT